MMIMEEKPDLISILPNEILHQIISALSFKEAVRSSTLSTTWRHLITPSRADLEQNWTQQELKQIIIESDVAKSGTSFRTLKLHLPSSDVAFAVCTRGVDGELHLDFSQQHKQQLLLPVPPRGSFSLIIENTGSLSRSSFSCIKILQLRSVSNLVGEMVSDLCSNFSSLESLKLERCGGLESVDIRSSDSLKNFEIADCSDIGRILVSAPNLGSFSYKGVFQLVQFLNVPNLVDVTLDFRDGYGDHYRTFDCEDVLSLLSSVEDIECLKVSSWLIEALCCAGVIFGKLDFQLSRLKELKLICSKTISSKTRDSFACFLHMTPSLEELELKMEHGAKCVENPYSNQNWHEPHLWKDYATVKSEACRLKYMKRIKIVGFTMEKDQLMWMDLLLHNAINLKEMIVDDSWRVVRVPYSQLNYIKLKYLIIPCTDIDSYFVLIADSSNNL